jgi:hypothetical protein
MGFFSPGFVIGAASSLTNQIEDAKERNAKMMERRRDQFDQLSREAKRELNRKKMTEQEYVDLAKEVLSPELKIQIGDDPALLAAAGKSFKTQSQVRGLTPSNFNKSLLLSGTTKEGKFDPTKAFNIIEPPKMDVETQTEEGFFGRAFRGITGAPSQQELAETDPSRLTTDIRGASVNLNRIYNPVPVDSREWANYEKLFAESENVKVVVDPFDRTIDRVKTFGDTEDSILRKFLILNGLRIGQAYTEDDLPSILTDVNTIYSAIGGHKSLSTEQADAVISKIASDMNRTSVSEVMKKLDQYVPKAGTGQTPGGTASTPEQPKPTESGIDPGLRQAITEQIESRNATNIQADESKPAVYEIKYNGKIFTVEMGVLGQPRILKTEG